MQLPARLLLYVVACANFCSRQGTTAQSGSIKALRSANLRRDGRESCILRTVQEDTLCLLNKLLLMHFNPGVPGRYEVELYKTIDQMLTPCLDLAPTEINDKTPIGPIGSRISLKITYDEKKESNHLTDLYRKEETISVGGNGCIHSPRFPSSYPRNLLLTWRLLSTENTRIQLAFDNQFGLEEPENDICRYDFVEVEDLSETSTVIRGRWCGHKEVPPRITSKTNQIKITFKSDDYFVAKPGFKIYYSLVDDFQPAASETNWESVTSSVSGVSYPSPSVTDPTLTAEALDQTIAGFDTVEELLRHFNPVSWQEDLENLYTDTGHHYRGRSYRDRKSKVDLDRLNDDVKRYSCTPRNYSVNLREELKLTNVVFFPRCLLIQRCGGNCGCGTVNWRSCTCAAGKTVKKYHEVLKFIPESGHPRRKGRTKNNMALVDIQLEHHERCGCLCSSRPPR